MPKECASRSRTDLPRDCTFTETDWNVLEPFWHPVAFSHEVAQRPFEARLLDERVVISRIADGTLVAAKDICCHRGVC